jgi:hypothetical protein
MPATIAVGLSATAPEPVSMADSPIRPHPLASRPDPRGPPSLV